MPTYEYECQSCHERVEAVQKFTDAALTTCPLCGGELRKVFSAVGIMFKGSGFYKNDSRDSSPGSTTATPSTNVPPVPASSSSSGGEGGATPTSPAAPAVAAPTTSTGSGSD